MKVGEQVVFQDEPGSQYTIRAMGPRFAVLTRAATKEDCELFEVEWEDANTWPIYTILDSQEWVRGPDHWIFGKYDYSIDDGCQKALSELESGECQISRRNMVKAFIE